jgi:Ca2+-transporting ATPase
VLPFDQDLKRMTTIREVDDNRIVVYSKGAPEFLIPQCETVLTMQFQVQSFHNSQDLLNGTISDIAGANGNDPHKVISLAFKTMDKMEYQGLVQKFNNDVEAEGFREYIEQKLTYVGTFGLNDPIRDNAQTSVELIKFGKELNSFIKEDYENEQQFNISQEVNVRMISGDHIETCRKVAFDAGIIT